MDVVAKVKKGDAALAGSGILVDGVDSTIIATVKDLANSNPLTTAIVDGSGNQITSFGGGTQYTEDAAAAADPVGTVPILVRKDTPAGIVSADGDNIAQRGTNYGAAYTQIVTSSGAYVDTFGGGTQYADGAVRGTSTGTLAMVDDGTNIQSVLGDSSGRLFTNISQINAVTPLMGAGNTGTGSLRVTIATDQAVIPVSDNGGSLTVDGTVAFSNTTIAVTNAGTFVTQENGAALTSLQLLDDVIATLGTTTYTEATTKGTIIGAVRRDADTTLLIPLTR
jgi:hypothetical protein